ncbi:type ISP restriction/modification enzyme [Streptomyces purpureus]|nr:type ISP restriction/modification enzyme [Streptomyces purpureus]
MLEKKLAPLPGSPEHETAIGQETALRPGLIRIGMRSFDRHGLVADNRVIDFPRPELWESLQPSQLFLNQQSSHEIDSGPAVVATALLPDTHHFNGRGGKVMPILHPDGTPNVPPGLLAHLTTELGIPRVTVHDLAAYVVAVTGHSKFTKQFTEELLTPGVRLPLTRTRSCGTRPSGSAPRCSGRRRTASATSHPRTAGLKQTCAIPRRIHAVSGPPGHSYRPDAPTAAPPELRSAPPRRVA